MNKEEFIESLRSRLGEIPPEELERSVEYYSEMIDDRIEDGMTEEEAVAQIGSVDDAVSQVLSGISLPKLIKNKASKHRNSSALQTLLAVMAFPVWFPLLITAIVLFITFFVLIIALVIVLFSIPFSFGISAIAALIGCVILLFTAQGTTASILLGGGLVCLGLFLFMCPVFSGTVKGVFRMSKRFVLWVKSLFIGRKAQ